MKLKICDIHVHLVGFERTRTGCYLRIERMATGLSKKLGESYCVDNSQLNEHGIDIRTATSVLSQIEDSVLDHAVLLALDGIYDTNGKSLNDKTVCRVDNDFVANLTSEHKKALFGASIHPYRRDALKELERLVGLGACLVKWIPSAQGIDLNHPRCLAFYDALSDLNVPLLCHAGVEHVIPGGHVSMNAPNLLRAALEREVTVIAAHCGARLFITEVDFFQQWARLTNEYPNLYGDISAFGFPLRRWALHKIIRDPILSERILFGSDFPSPILLCSYLGMVKCSDLSRLNGLSNPFDKAVETMKAAGVPDVVFNRAYPLLRMNREITFP